MAELAALHEGHARYVLGYANALLQSRELAEEASLEVLLTGWRAGLAREPDQRAIRLLLMSLVLREVAVLRRQARNSCRDTPPVIHECAHACRARGVGRSARHSEYSRRGSCVAWAVLGLVAGWLAAQFTKDDGYGLVG